MKLRRWKSNKTCFMMLPVISRLSVSKALDSQTEFVLFHASSIPGKMMCSLSFVLVPPLRIMQMKSRAGKMQCNAGLGAQLTPDISLCTCHSHKKSQQCTAGFNPTRRA